MYIEHTDKAFDMPQALPKVRIKRATVLAMIVAGEEGSFPNSSISIHPATLT